MRLYCLMALESLIAFGDRMRGALYRGRQVLPVALLVITGLISAGAIAQNNPDFDVSVTTGLPPLDNATVSPGQATSIRITLINRSVTAPLTEVRYSGVLPTSGAARMVINGTAAITPGACGGSLTAAENTQSLSFANITVPINVPSGAGECYVDVPVRVESTTGASTSLSYGIAVGEAQSGPVGAPLGNITGGSQGITLLPASRPSLSKSFDTNNILVLGGAARTLRITVTNTGGSSVDLTGVGFEDIFPVSGADGAIMEPTGDPATGSCIGPGVATLQQGPNAGVTVSDVAVSAGSSCTILVPVRARQTDGDYQVTTVNRIDDSSFTSVQGLTPAADATASVRVRSPLAVNKVFNPAVLASGTQGTFTVTLTNAGTDPLAVNNFEDNPIGTPDPGNLLIGSTADISNSCGGTSSLLGSSPGEGFAVGGFSIPAGGNCQIVVTFTGVNNNADTPIVYTNSISEGAVDITEAVGAPEVISQQRSATVIVADRLRVLKAASPASAAPGEAVRYNITVQNFSSTPLSDVGVVDNFQNGATLLLASPYEPGLTASCGVLDTGSASVGDSAIDFSIPSIPARTGVGAPGECVVSVWVMIDPDATAPTNNVIAAGGVCFGPSGSETCNQGASNSVTTGFRAPVAFNKTIDGLNTVNKPEGQRARLRLELSNSAAAALSNVVFSDTLPSAGPFQQLRVASPPNINNSCGGSVNAAAGSTSVALNGGTVPAFASGSPGVCAIELDIVGPAGSYPNTAQATGTRPNADGSNSDIAPAPLSDSATINYGPALQSSKSFTPDSAAGGATSTLEIRFTNIDPTQPITSIAATDNLPAGLTVASPSNAYSTCAGSPSISATPGASSVSVSGARLAPNTSCAVLVDVLAQGSADWVNTIPAGAITADNGIVNSSPVSATLDYVAPEIPLISKAISPGSIVPGQSATLTVTINNGAQDLTGVSLTDWFTMDGTPGGTDNGMRIAPAPRATTNCAAGIVSAMAGDNSLRLSGASIPASTNCQFAVQVTSESVGTIVNRIPVSTLTSDQGATNSTSFAESSLSTSSDIGVTKQFTPAVISNTETSRLRITIFNGQPAAISGISLTDTYPAGLENAPDPNPISSCGGAAVLTLPDSSSISISGGRVAAANGTSASSCFIEVNVVAPTLGSYLNEIPADTLQVRGVPVTHPPASSILEVRERIIVNKAIDSLTLDPGNPNGFSTGVADRLPGVSAPLRIRLENPNSIALTEVRFTDSLPDGLTLAVPPNLSSTCVNGVVSGVGNGRELTLTGATLAASGNPGASCVVSADVKSNVPGVYTNEIPVGDVTSFEGIDNDPGTQAQIVITEPPTIGKDFDPPVIPPNGSARLRITLGNDNDVAATLSADFVDLLPTTPGPMLIASPANGDIGSCVGTFNAVAGNDRVTLVSGATIPAGGCVLAVDVSAVDAGDYLNNIPVGALRTSIGTNDQPADARLKVSTLGYISGKVFLDNQTVPDGVFIPGASDAIDGNSVELRTGSTCTGALLETTTTDGQGNYLFSDLAAGTYSVCQPVQPAGTLNSVTTEGSIVPFGASTGSAGTAGNPSASSSQITGIVLGDNAGNSSEVSGSPDNNFSEVLPASLRGNVFFDSNNDGTRDAGEPGIGGVIIRLTGPVILTSTTAADGSWSFNGLPPGDYTVTEEQPGGWVDGQDARGTVGGIGVGDDSLSDVISAITLGPGSAGVEYNFGEIAPAALAVNANAVCVNNVPYVDYSIAGFTGASSPAVTVSWITAGGRVAAQLTNQPGSGRLLWPGATVDSSGNGTGWPGWAFVDGAWIEVPDDRAPDLTFQVEFNPTGSAGVSYPPAAPACAAQPPGTFTARSIPATSHWLLLMTALALLGAASRRLSGARKVL